jgi:hypothetical protein
MTTTIGTVTPTAMAVIFVPEVTLGDAVESDNGVEVDEASCVVAEIVFAELVGRRVLCDLADVTEADTAMFNQPCAIIAASQDVGIQFGAMPFVCPS